MLTRLPQETRLATPVGAVSNRTDTQHLPYVLSEETAKTTSVRGW